MLKKLRIMPINKINPIMQLLAVVSLFSMAVIVSVPASAQERLAVKRYDRQAEWKLLPQFIPADFQFTDKIKPIESAWTWENHTIHLDRLSNANAPAKIILLHPIATNGRIMSLLLGAKQAQNGYEVISPDLPGFGLTKIAVDGEYTYDAWVRMIDSLIANEKQKDSRPIFLVGVGSGGMLAYHVAQINTDVAGVFVTALYDTSSKLDKKMSQNKFFAEAVQPLAKVIGQSKLWKIPFSSKTVYSHTKTINMANVRKLIEKDPSAGGAWLSSRFIDSYLTYQPSTPPSEFTTCPVEFAYPEQDKLLSKEDSLVLLNQLTGVTTQVVTLPEGGNIPFETPALNTLNQKLDQFIIENLPVKPLQSAKRISTKKTKVESKAKPITAKPQVLPAMPTTQAQKNVTHVKSVLPEKALEAEDTQQPVISVTPIGTANVQPSKDAPSRFTISNR